MYTVVRAITKSHIRPLLQYQLEVRRPITPVILAKHVILRDITENKGRQFGPAVGEHMDLN